MNTAASASGSALIALIVVIFFLIGIASIIGVVERRKLQSTREVQADPVAATSPKKSPDISQSPLSTGVPQPAINEVSTHESEPSICPSCSKLLRLGDRFCSQCGYRVLMSCPSCSKPLRPGDRFCSQCGYRLIKETPSILPTIKNTSDLTCPGCHAPLQPQDQFCGTCGAHTTLSNDATQWHSQ